MQLGGKSSVSDLIDAIPAIADLALKGFGAGIKKIDSEDGVESAGTD